MLTASRIKMRPIQWLLLWLLAVYVSGNVIRRSVDGLSGGSHTVLGPTITVATFGFRSDAAKDVLSRLFPEQEVLDNGVELVESMQMDRLSESNSASVIVSYLSRIELLTGAAYFLDNLAAALVESDQPRRASALYVIIENGAFETLERADQWVRARIADTNGTGSKTLKVGYQPL